MLFLGNKVPQEVWSTPGHVLCSSFPRQPMLLWPAWPLVGQWIYTCHVDRSANVSNSWENPVSAPFFFWTFHHCIFPNFKKTMKEKKKAQACLDIFCVFPSCWVWEFSFARVTLVNWIPVILRKLAIVKVHFVLGCGHKFLAWRSQGSRKKPEL